MRGEGASSEVRSPCPRRLCRLWGMQRGMREVAGAGSAMPDRATRWRRVRDGRATRWHRVAQYFLATAHMPTFAPLGGVECAVCVPLGGAEWHAGRSSLCLESRTVLACAHQKPQRAFCRILEPCSHPITIESVVWASRHATHSAPAPPCATRHKEEKVCPTTFWPSSEAPH